MQDLKKLKEQAEAAIAFHREEHAMFLCDCEPQFPDEHYEKTNVVVEAGTIISLLDEVQNMHTASRVTHEECQSAAKRAGLLDKAWGKSVPGVLADEVVALRAALDEAEAGLEIESKYHALDLKQAAQIEKERNSYKRLVDSYEKDNTHLREALKNAVDVMKATATYKHFLCLSGAIQIGEEALGLK